MTTMTDPPSKSFRLSMLLHDTRYRSFTFQFIALIVVVGLIAYLGSNLVQNLRAAGLNISYGFLGEPAGYDINQRIIEYDSQSSHMRASIVGVLRIVAELVPADLPIEVCNADADQDGELTAGDAVVVTRPAWLAVTPRESLWEQQQFSGRGNN